MFIQITRGAVFDLLNQADEDGTPYGFEREHIPSPKKSPPTTINLFSPELGVRITIERNPKATDPSVNYYLNLEN